MSNKTIHKKKFFNILYNLFDYIEDCIKDNKQYHDFLISTKKKNNFL